MKFTEGYWEKNERANASYAMQAFTAEAIPGGMRIVSPFRQITDRGGALDVGTITTEFISVRKDIISVRSYHYEGYVKGEPRYELNEDPQETEVEITEDEAVMKAGRMTVRVDLKDFKITYEADGKVLTNIGFRNLGYMQYDRATLTKFPEPNYMAAQYQPYMVTELSLAPGECVYGLGERFTAFVKNGQVVDIWNEDGGTASQISYKNIPFYVTSKHYGVFVDHSDHVSFEVASEKVENVGFSVKGEEIRYHIIYGDDIKGVIENYTDLTGKPALPPAWSFGLWLSTSFTTNYDEETTNSFIQGMADRDIPLSVFHFDCFWMKEFHWCDFEWDSRIFPDVPGMLKRYKDKGLKICVWINPYIAQGTNFFKEGLKNGYLVQRADGRGIKQIDNWQPGMGLVDFTNPDAVKWYQNKLKTLLDMGVDCFKTDFGERIPVDVKYYDGSDPVSMHNYYTYLYNKAVFDLLKEVKGEGEAILFARSATAGGQQFPVHWGGDCSATYASMAESLRGGLSFTLSGFSFWSHDMGGFEMTAAPDVYKRWLQFGLLSTHSRLHGSKSYRVPWLFDEEAVDVCRKFTKLKLRLLPYLYSMAVKSHKTGIPSMRTMIMEQLFSADVVIFNRCDDSTDKGKYRRNVKALNRKAQLVYERADGTLDERPEELPFDITADEIEISDADYAIWYMDCQDNPKKYEGKKVSFLALVYNPDKLKKGIMVPGRFAMTCCVEDVTFIGFKTKYDREDEIPHKSWINITAEVHVEFAKEYKGKGPVLYPISVTPAEKPEDELVYFS